MFHVPEFYPDISLKLSRVLEEIGVNEKMILKKRRTLFLHDTLTNISTRIEGWNRSCHYFGSQSEGTTTTGLLSDSDVLICYHDKCVIQDWGEWELGKNFLMIQEENTPPGYCMLQELYNDQPFALTELHTDHHIRYRGDRGDKVLLKNTVVDNFLSRWKRNGPAGTSEGIRGHDYVPAFPFKTMPEFLVSWLQQQTQQGKLSLDMKRYMESNPCYVVAVVRKDSPFETAEWRISTSHAERCLILSLNITQLQCYIMLKLLLKTFLKHPQEKGLSSFMCKNILLLCIGQTHPSKWIPQNLLSVFRFVLLQLKRSILQEHCPHFIIHENNLMAKKFTPQVKSWLLKKIQQIYESHGCAFLGIEIDDIGNRLLTRLNTPSNCMIVRDIQENQSTGRYISGSLLFELAVKVSFEHKHLLQSTISGKNTFNGIITTLVEHNNHGNHLEQAASRLLTPLICSSLGSVIASRDIHQDHSISPEALTWLSLGLNSDVASGRLKLASVFYCVGDFNTTERILRSIEEICNQKIVMPVCNCYDLEECLMSTRFQDYANSHNELAIQHIVAYCVRFLPHEVHCQPRELQYEMFRSTQEDRAHRDERYDFWMDWAVVDSLPYLYFLQYKTYGHLQRHDEQQLALIKLVLFSYRTINLMHKETALNLLGQCYQQENRHSEALQCYMDSLNVRQTNNAAKLHICRLLYGIYANNQYMQ